MRVLGIDPGTTALGYGVIESDRGLTRIASGVIRVRAAPLAERLCEIERRLMAVIREHAPEAAALEAVFSYRNPRSALQLGHARGVALAACGAAGLPAAEYAPSQIKRAVSGSGRADKGQVQAMVRRLLALETLPATDEADALAAAICHAARAGTGARVGLRSRRRGGRSLREVFS